VIAPSIQKQKIVLAKNISLMYHAVLLGMLLLQLSNTV